ncbi:MAG: histidine kinase dimerization/phospho-acceptor domain-containing protein, partial [Candidatus Hydrogenedentota bacterium]
MTGPLDMRQEGRAVVLTLSGRAPIAGDPELRGRLMQAIQNSKFIVIDISSLESFDWEDLGVLVALRKAHRERWGAHMHLFKIVVPRGRHRVMVESMHMEHILATYRSLSEALATLPQRRALHIEPADDLANVVEILLEANGFEVTRCAHPDSLSDRDQLGDFDIILTELRFGAETVPDLVRRLRLEFAAPVGVLTADPPESVLGAAFVLAKPFIPGALLGQLVRAMELPLHQYYQSVFDSLPTPICIVSSQGNLQRFNTAWSDLFHVTPVAARDSDLRHALPPEYPHMQALLKKIMSMGQGDEDADLFVKAVDGACRLNAMRFRFASVESGSPDPHIIVAVADASLGGAWESPDRPGDPRMWNAMLSLLEDLDAARTELSNANIRLMGLDRLKGDFISTVSHELRTPIAAIKGSIENILDGYLGEVAPRQRRAIEIALRNSRRLARLIENLLDLSRLETSTLVLRKKMTDLRESLQSAVEEVQPITEKLGAVVELDLPGDPVLLDVDPDRMGQIIINLLDNALRFCRGHVRISLATQGHAAVIRVEDNGTGIHETD